MNNPIIIDGVDVSECEFKSLFDNRCCSFADDTENLNCNNKDCYYKQLQRLKKENERLKAECMQMVNENYASTDWRELEDIKAENEELKKDKKYRLEEIQNLNNKIKILTSITDKTNKYKQALVEINKIAEPRFVNGLNEEADLCNLAMDRIQNIINEVLKNV